MSTAENRNIVIARVRSEIIGPGSDIFQCKDDFSDEIIEGKPLQRYFSGILFPKQRVNGDPENPENEFKDVNNPNDEDENNGKANEDAILNKSADNNTNNEDAGEDTDRTDTQPKYTANTFYPSHFGITFSVDKSCEKFKASISFGNYIKAKPEEIKIPYNGEGINLLTEHGLNGIVSFDEENKVLSQTKKIQRTKEGKLTEEYLSFQDSLKSLGKATSYDHALHKTISKLFFKDKFKRNNNRIELEISIADILSAPNQHLQLILAEQPKCDTENWSKELKENLVFHLKLYTNYSNKYYIKAIIENKVLF